MKAPLLLLSFFMLFSCSSNKLIVQEEVNNEILAFQDHLNEFYSNPDTSPLKEKADKFTGHKYYPIDLTYRVEARVVRLNDQPFFKIPTSGSMTPEYRKYAYLDFEIKGQSHRLTVLQNKKNMSNPLYRDRLFLPFQDATNGDLTYGGGRYIDLKIPQGDKMVLYFNQSYHPYCAFTDGYNCPIPPSENRLDIAVEAGIILPAEYR